LNLVVATSGADALGGVFARAYIEAGGPAPVVIIEQASRKGIGFSGAASAFAAIRLLGVTGSLRMLFARKLGLHWFAKDRERGLHLPWVETLAAGRSRIIRCRSINDPDIVRMLSEIKPDLLVSIGSPFIIKPPTLAQAMVGALNVHNARLPRFRGHFGTFWEVLGGESIACVTIHEMVPKVDLGRVIRTECVEVASIPSFLDLMIEKKTRGGRLLAQLVLEVERTGSLPPDVPASPGEEAHYYHFPSIRELLRFRFPSRPKVVKKTS
jgi:hypothetical protein